MAKTATDLRAAGALETADLVRRGEVSALEVCEAAIDRIERLDNEIHAVVVKDYERARAAAKAVDATRAADDARPLLGVAMTVKESNNITGLPTTWGFEDFRDWCPPADAIAVERLKAAGAVILGKTNAPVALGDWQSFNPVYGRTSNPHDLTRTPGGSSGGSAAALAAGMVPLEVGSDIGGSIRAPAHFCGVFGHKPTYGVVPMRGHGFPGTDGLDVPLAVVGPMARRADDLTAAFNIIAGSTLPGWRLDLPVPRCEALSDYRVLVLPPDGLPRVAADVWRPVQLLAEALEDAGAQVERFSGKLPDIMALHENYLRMLTSVTMRGAPDARPMDAHKWFEAQDLQLAHKRAWAGLFEDFDIVLAPIASMTAFPHASQAIWFEPDAMIDGEPVRYGSQLVWAGLATYSELPATAIPLAMAPGGLPTGVQAIGPQAGDLTTLRFAQLIETEGLCLDPAANFPAP